MPTSQQFICRKCGTLAEIESFQRTQDGRPFCSCPACGAKNAVVQTGMTPSQPGIVPVIGLLD